MLNRTKVFINYNFVLTQLENFMLIIKMAYQYSVQQCGNQLPGFNDSVQLLFSDIESSVKESLFLKKQLSICKWKKSHLYQMGCAYCSQLHTVFFFIKRRQVGQKTAELLRKGTEIHPYPEHVQYVQQSCNKL